MAALKLTISAAEIIIFFNIVSKYNTKKPPDKRFYKLLIFCKFVTKKIYT